MEPSYSETLIAVAADCPATEGTVPRGRKGVATIATLQYELLATNPYVYTQADVLFETWFRRHSLSDGPATDRTALRAAFFRRPQACLRASPLAKTYGWGFHFDTAGRVALCPRESVEYHHLLTDQGVTVLPAMRSKRA